MKHLLLLGCLLICTSSYSQLFPQELLYDSASYTGSNTKSILYSKNYTDNNLDVGFSLDFLNQYDYRVYNSSDYIRDNLRITPIFIKMQYPVPYHLQIEKIEIIKKKKR